MESLRRAAQSTWENIWIGMFAENEFLIKTVGTVAVGLVCFLLANFIFLLIDLTGYPSWIYKYKIQEDKNFPVEKRRALDVFKTALFNLVVINLFFMVMSYPLLNWYGTFRCTGPLPSFGELVVHFTVFRILEECGNYYGHRILHMPQFYKYHKKHHEWTAPIGMVAVYCGPIEHFFGNILPVSAGPFIMKSHLFVAWLWELLVLTSVTIEHSGYHIPFLFSPEGHDFHHKTFTSWYGTMAFLDVLHGTDKPFSSSVQGRRQFVSCSLTPVKESVPGEICNKHL
ncbi:hypothetical protein ACHWQZ_G011646 [Mnemiopsis leidyi]